MRYLELQQMERDGKIKALSMQPKFLLHDGFRHEGKKYRAIHYIADFEYIDGGIRVVEDTKGFKTEIYKIKKKLFLGKYGDKIKFKES